MHDRRSRRDVHEPMQPLPILPQTTLPAGCRRDREHQQNHERRLTREDEGTLQDVVPDRAELTGPGRVAELIEDEIRRQMEERVRERPDAEHATNRLKPVDLEDE